MAKKPDENGELVRQNEELRRRLDEAEETLAAIRNGEVDALVVNTAKGDQVFTLKNAERSYRIMVEQMTEGALTFSLEGTILFCNRRFAEILGFPLETIISASIYDYVARESQTQFRKLRDQNGLGEIELLTESKNHVPVHVSLAALTLDEDIRVFCAVVTDLTERKLVEAQITKYRENLEELVEQRTAELAAANRELEAFSYSVSHDLRAPLRSLAGFSQALLEDYGGKLDDKGHIYLQEIRASAMLMSELIDDLLNLSRTTRSEISLEDFCISDIAQEIALELSASEPGRKAIFKITPGLGAYGDRRLLKVVLTNLLGNSFKFTAKTVSPAIEFSTVENDGPCVYFVRDNGAGFDMHYADKLFVPFQRLHSKADFPGTGIGLALVSRIIQRHGGHIWAESEVGKGATFYFTLGQARRQGE